MTATVVGIDLSLTNTGYAKCQMAGGSFHWEVAGYRSTGKKGDSLSQRHMRLSDIDTSIAHAVDLDEPDLVVVEAPSFGSRYGSQHDRSGLWWMVVDGLIFNGYPVATVPPTSRAKYATGKGNAGKDEVLASVVRTYGSADVTDNNIADAVVLAAMGMRHLGYPVELDMSQVKLTAMDGAEWPT